MERVILRQIWLRGTYAIFAIPCGLIVGVSAVWTFGAAIGIKPDAKVYDLGLFPVVFSFVLLIVGFILGMSVGGWLWSRAAKHVFHFTKAEVEHFLITPGSPRFLNSKNQKAIDKLYEQRNSG